MQPIARFRQAWYNASSSLWFVPGLMAVAALVLSLMLTLADRALDLHDDEGERLWLLQASASSSRAILGTIATASATVLGVVFSITIIALQLASTQYSPRVLREFMRDRGSQIVMGIFIGTFVYALSVSRSIRDFDEGLYFVPIIALNVGILLALASMGALIYFINHIAENIQVSNLVARLSRETTPLLDHPFPGQCGRPLEREPELDHQSFASVPAPVAGYIQVVEGESLIELAARHDVVIEIRHRVGDFVAEGAELMRVYPDRPLDRAFLAEIRGLVALGRRRTLQQDAEFGVRQISDIAVKAMSPSINDPTTALLCLDHFDQLLRRIALHHDPLPVRADAAGSPRLIVHGPSFESVAWLIFTPLRIYAKHDPNVVLRYLEVLEHTGKLVATEERRAVIWTHVRMLASVLDAELKGEVDRLRVNDRLRELGRVVRYAPDSLLLPARLPSA